MVDVDNKIENNINVDNITANMAYIETIKRGKQNFYYLSQTIRIGKKFRKVRRILGKGNIPKSRLDILAKNAAKALQEQVKEIKTINTIFRLDAETEKQLEEIKKEYKKILKKLSRIEYGVIEKHHLINFTFNTNAIEGSTITLKEAAHILEDGIAPPTKELREIHEVENTKKAYQFIKQYRGEISLDLIRKIHYNLTSNILDEQAGKFRSIQVFMAGSKHLPSKASEVHKEILRMLHWVRNHKDLHPIITAAYIHHFFIAIHPFIDGNGRTGRLLLNFMLLKAGYPPICIRLKERIKYTNYLEQARDGNPEHFIMFIITKLKEAFKDIVDNTKYN